MDNNDVKVSVIMPVYNAGDYLRPAIESVLDQTLKEIEIICIDDGSTDKSLKVLQEYQKQDERIRIVAENNAGPALARNKGITRARGEYVAFLDADDIFEPIMLESMYNVAKRDDLDIVLVDYDVYNTHTAKFEVAARNEYEEIYQPGKVTSKSEYPNEIFQSTTGAAWNKLFRRSFVQDKNLVFLPEAKIYEDVYFVVCALSLAERVGKVFEVQMHHRVYPSQWRAKTFKKYCTQIPEVYSAISEFLRAHGMLAPLKNALLNLSASRCYKTYNILNKDAKENFWNVLHDGYNEKMGWKDYTKDDFQQLEVCEFVACVELYNYNEYKKMISRRHLPRLDRLKQILNSAKSRKKFKQFFAKIFHKKTDTTQN